MSSFVLRRFAHLEPSDNIRECYNATWFCFLKSRDSEASFSAAQQRPKSNCPLPVFARSQCLHNNAGASRVSLPKNPAILSAAFQAGFHDANHVSKSILSMACRTTVLVKNKHTFWSHNEKSSEQQCAVSLFHGVIICNSLTTSTPNILCSFTEKTRYTPVYQGRKKKIYLQRVRDNA